MNTLMIQQVLAEAAWQGRFTLRDLQALSPLKWQHINPYRTFIMNMQERLPERKRVSPWLYFAAMTAFARLRPCTTGDDKCNAQSTGERAAMCSLRRHRFVCVS